MLIRRKMIRERALELLERFAVKQAPVPVDDLARLLGAKVVKQDAPDELSGFVLREPTKGVVIIGVNAKHPPNRQRFTVGHELGHFLLHEGERLHIDKQWTGYQVKLRSEQSSTGTNVDEMEANLFAAELLMPVPFINTDLAKLAPSKLSAEKNIIQLAKKYKVSEQALTLRLTSLGYIQ